MNALPKLIQRFFTERLPSHRGASPNTIASYRDAIKQLLIFAAENHHKTVDALTLSDLGADTVTAFLTHLENDKHNTPATRNTRLSAIHSLFRYAAINHPEHAAFIARVLDIPAKKGHKRTIDYLREDQAQMLLAAPDPDTWTGRRDRLLMGFMIQTGFRATETVSATLADVHLGPCSWIQCTGKGRKQRTTPLDAGIADQISAWTSQNHLSEPAPLFGTRQGDPLTRNALWRLVTKHANSVADRPEMATKHVTPHVLRHTAAMRLLHGGVDLATIALWLGHEQIETTYVYLHADLERKQAALDQTAPLRVPPGRYQPSPDILTFLATL